MNERICPKDMSVCQHPAACNPLDRCNKPVPISEFKVSHPEVHAAFAKGLADGTLVIS